MTFEDLYKIDDPIEKEEKIKEFYLKEIKVDKWIKYFPNSVIRFHDRKEYRENNKLHNLNGPAIEYMDTRPQTTDDKIYFIEGEHMNYNDWLVLSKRKKLNKKLKKIKKTQ